MESKKKIRKAAPSSSSSSDSETSSSSSSEETRRKQKHRSIRKQQRESSSSSENETVRKLHKHGSHKKAARKHSHSTKVRTKLPSGKKKRSLSPASRLAHKHHMKVKVSKKSKVAHLEDHERRSRSPTRRDVKKDRTPDHRIASPTTRIRVSVPNNRVIRSAGRSLKDSPLVSRRHVREPVGDKERAEIHARCQERQRERERMKRMQDEEERFKHVGSRIPDRSRIVASSHVAPEMKHRHDRSRSQSRGKIPIRERLDKEYEYRRSNSREHEDYPPIIRPVSGAGREPMRAYSRDRPPLRDEPERNFDYRSEDRRIANHDYGLPTRVYDERHHRPQNWEAERDVEPRSSRIYEGRDWESGGHSKRIPEEPYKDSRERTWSDLPLDKWSKEKDPKEWSRSWKEPGGSAHPSSTPTMSHPRRWPGPGQSESWAPRGSHPASHKIDHAPVSGSFKPRFGGPGTSPHFGFKRFPFKRFPNLYSKINYSSRRVIPSSATSTSAVSASIVRPPLKTADNSADSPVKSDLDHMHLTQAKVEATESGEITTEPEEDKVEADTTFSGNVDTQSQEEEGNLSEFSDIDDEILNREEELARGVAAELNASGDEQNGDQNDLKIISKIHANKELKKEMDLDFEEISDGELEEESRIKGLGDALGVDWASLAKETQLPIKHEPEEFISSTKARWTPHRILWDIGVSSKLAGEDYARRKLIEARNELRREKQELLQKMEQVNSEKSALTNGDIKQELAVAANEVTDEVKIKAEPKDEEDEEVKQEEACEETAKIELPEDDFDLDGDVLVHPLAQVQVLLRKIQTKRKNLILHSTGKYGRALSARRDLKIRRQLLNLPTRDIKINRSCVTNPELHKNVDAIYRRLVGDVS